MSIPSRAVKARLAASALLMLATMLVLAPGDPAAAGKAVPVALDTAAKADITRIETYLNGITTLRARFLQVADTGQAVSGLLTIARPGRMRFEYDPPSPMMLIADGTFLIYIDRALGQTTHVFLRNTPVGVLVAENIKLGGAVTITGFSRGPSVVRVTLTKTDEPEEGNITLVFADSPLTLRQWVVIDSQGAQTSVTLDDVQYGVATKPEMFKYEKPAENSGRD